MQLVVAVAVLWSRCCRGAGHTVHSMLEAVKDDILPPVLPEIDLSGQGAAAAEHGGAVDASAAEAAALPALIGGAASLSACLDDIIEVVIEDTLGCVGATRCGARFVRR